METEYINKCRILGELWLKYKHDSMFDDFVDYNDIGLPLAFSVAEEIIPSSPTAELYINETWYLFMESLEIEDAGFENLDQVLDK